MYAVQYKGETKQFAPEEISSMIVGHMRDIAQNFMGEKKVKKGVITTPAYFNDSQRQVCMLDPLVTSIATLTVSHTPRRLSLPFPRTSAIGSARRATHYLSGPHDYNLGQCFHHITFRIWIATSKSQLA